MKSTILLLLGVYSLVCIVNSVPADIQHLFEEVHRLQPLHMVQDHAPLFANHEHPQANMQHVVNLKNLLQKMSTKEKDSLQSYYWSKLLDHLSKQNGAASKHSFLKNLLDKRQEKAFLMNLLSKFDKKEKAILQQYYSKKLLQELKLNQDSTNFKPKH